MIPKTVIPESGLGVTKFARHKLKFPYFAHRLESRAKCFYVLDGVRVHVLARLMVSEKEFWERLGKALGIKFVGWEQDGEVEKETTHHQEEAE